MINLSQQDIYKIVSDGSNSPKSKISYSRFYQMIPINPFTILTHSFSSIVADTKPNRILDLTVSDNLDTVEYSRRKTNSIEDIYLANVSVISSDSSIKYPLAAVSNTLRENQFSPIFKEEKLMLFNKIYPSYYNATGLPEQVDIRFISMTSLQITFTSGLTYFDIICFSSTNIPFEIEKVSNTQIKIHFLDYVCDGFVFDLFGFNPITENLFSVSGTVSLNAPRDLVCHSNYNESQIATPFLGFNRSGNYSIIIDGYKVSFD